MKNTKIYFKHNCVPKVLVFMHWNIYKLNENDIDNECIWVTSGLMVF